ncbi:MAG: alpha/beta fold hydrolase [Caldisericia bacterium]
MGYLRVNDTKIYYEIDGNGKPLAFLNGIFMSTQSFSTFLPLFSKNYQVLLHDFRGQKSSGKDGEKYSLELHADDFYKLLKALGINKIDIVGVSYGGEVALRFVVSYPEMVNSLVIVSSVSEVDDELNEKIVRWVEGAKSKNSEIFVNSWLQDVYSPKFLEKYESFLRNKLKESLKNFDYDASIKLMEAFLELKKDPLTPLLNKIKVPTLVVAGELDTLKPIKFSKIIQDRIENSELVIVGGSGHAIPIEKKNELETIIFGFLEKNRIYERS